jgi:hypothetical protein
VTVSTGSCSGCCPNHPQDRQNHGKKWWTEVVYAVTSLPAAQATDAEVAACIRGHWCVENLHWIATYL